jgi:hypothetical protein
MDTIQHSKSDPENQPTTEVPAHSLFDVSTIAAYLEWFKNVFDYLGGSREEPPAGMSFLASPWWVGLWWGLMIGLILLFCGQTSKFIYIDF